MVGKKYHAYPEYKDSGVEWLGKVPAHWRISKIKYLTPFQVGWTPPTGRDENFIGNNLWANISDLKKRYLYETAKQISDKAVQAASMEITPKGSLLYSFKLSVGAVSFAGIDLYTNEAIASFLMNSNIPLSFLYYALPEFVIKNASVNIYGARILNQELINNALLLAPSFDESLSIANFLDHETAKIDRLIKKQKKLIKLLKEKRISLAHNAIADKKTVPAKLSCVTKIVEDPIKRNEIIEYIPIGIFNRGRGLFHKEARQGRDLGDSTFFRIEQGDLILSGQFSWEGAVALAEKEDEGCIASHRFPILRTNPKILQAGYLYTYFMTDMGFSLLDQYSIGSAGRNRPLNIGKLLKEKIPIPPLEEQHKITKMIEKEYAVKKRSNFLIAYLQERRTALISAAVTGKIDVRNWQAMAQYTDHVFNEAS